MEPHRPFDVSWESLWKITAIVAMAAIAYAGLRVILGFFLAIVIAAALDGPITWLQKKRIPRVVGALVIFTVGCVVVAALIYAVVPLAISESTTLFAHLTKFKAGNTGSILGIIKVSQVVNIAIERFNGFANALITGNVSLLSVASFLLGGIFLTIAVFVLSFYLTVGTNTWLSTCWIIMKRASTYSAAVNEWDRATSTATPPENIGPTNGIISKMPAIKESKRAYSTSKSHKPIKTEMATITLNITCALSHLPIL